MAGAGGALAVLILRLGLPIAQLRARASTLLRVSVLSYDTQRHSPHHKLHHSLRVDYWDGQNFKLFHYYLRVKVQKNCDDICDLGGANLQFCPASDYIKIALLKSACD